MDAVRTDLTVRPTGPEDTGRILELLRLSLGEGQIPRSREYWTWKHEANPFGASPGLVAEVDGEIVGLRVFMRWGWRAGEREVGAVRAVDTATHPEWRGRRIFTRLTLELVERLEANGSAAFVFNTPNDRSRPGYLKMGWSQVGRVSLWVRPRRPWRILRSLLAKGGAPRVERDEPGKAFPSVGRFLDRLGVDSFLVDSGAGDRRLSTRRSSDYLRWRYAEIPGFDYRAIWSKEDGGAAVIFRVRRRGDLLELRLCETLVRPGSSAQHRAGALIRKLVRAMPVDYAVAMGAPGTPERRALLRSGFLPAPRTGPILTVRPLSDRLEPDPLRRSSWRLSIGDLELF